MKAYWRDDLQEEGQYPACNEELTHNEWAYLDFEVMETHKDFNTAEGFNMILRHPKTGKLLLARSKDFNFCEHYKSWQLVDKRA